MLTVQPLTIEAFQKYGTFNPLAPPSQTPLVGGDDKPISFWPDAGGTLSLGPLASNVVAIGVCQVKWRKLAIDVSEIHCSTGEGIVPLDGDVLLHLAPPNADDLFPTKECFEVFLIPQYTCVIIKPGVWHHAPYATTKNTTVNSIILLPPRTYANDCVVKSPDASILFQ